MTPATVDPLLGNLLMGDALYAHAHLIALPLDDPEIVGLFNSHDLILVVWRTPAGGPNAFMGLNLQGRRKFVAPTVSMTVIPVEDEHDAYALRDLYRAEPMSPPVPRPVPVLVWDRERAESEKQS